MEREARIKIVGKSVDSGEDVSFFTVGTVSEDKLCTTIEYASGSHNTKITVSAGTVVVSKVGEMTYSMILEEGKVGTAEISTEYGRMEAEVATDCLTVSRTDGRLVIDLYYTISIGENILGKNRFTVDAKF